MRPLAGCNHQLAVTMGASKVLGLETRWRLHMALAYGAISQSERAHIPLLGGSDLFSLVELTRNKNYVYLYKSYAYIPGEKQHRPRYYLQTRRRGGTFLEPAGVT